MPSIHRSSRIRSRLFSLLFFQISTWHIFLFCVVSTRAAAPKQESDSANKELEKVVQLLDTQNSESASEAIKIIRRMPEESWAIVDEIAASGYLPKVWQVMAQVDFGELINKWGNNDLLDEAILVEIRNRLISETDVQSLKIDRESALEMFRKGISNNQTRFHALRMLQGLPQVTFGEALTDSIIGCLDDEGQVEMGGSCSGPIVYTVRRSATVVLSQHVASHEQKLIQLLEDPRDYRRRCGIEIIVGDSQVLSRHGDRILELVEDQNPEVRDTAIRKLSLLEGRTKDVVKVLTNLKVKNFQSINCLGAIFPRSDKRDQIRIANWIVDRVVEEGRLTRAYPDELKKILPELDQPTLDKMLQRLLAKFERSKPCKDWEVDLLSAAGPRAGVVKPALRRMLKDSSAVMKPVVATALFRVTQNADEVLPYYQAALDADDFSLHSAAISGVRELRAEAAPLVPHLIPYLDESRPCNYLYFVALRKIGPAAIAAVPKLEQLRQTAESEKFKKQIESTLRVIRNETDPSSPTQDVLSPD